MDLNEKVKQLTPKQREKLDVRMALAVFEQMHKEGQINDTTIKGIRKNAEKRIDKLSDR